MIGEGRDDVRRFLDRVAEPCLVSPRMRRGLEIRVAFAPTRLSVEHLRAVYEVVTPMTERAVVKESVAVRENEADENASMRRRRGAP